MDELGGVSSNLADSLKNEGVHQTLNAQQENFSNLLDVLSFMG